jgi:hypothetical protein
MAMLYQTKIEIYVSEYLQQILPATGDKCTEFEHF